MSRPLLIKSATIGQRRIKVYYDRALEEYCTKFYIHAEHQTEADYFCPDQEDAFGTARQFLWEGLEDVQKRLREFKHENHGDWRTALRELFASGKDCNQRDGHLLRKVRNGYLPNLNDMCRDILGPM